ncbi:MAG: matrixin family metalloprotease [Bdellovibrionaceae bacterium]|jgi:hypothetical protein|nr:matrixin family metalloprotease [Pseudobdellovibrionaceae bacterium]
MRRLKHYNRKLLFAGLLSFILFIQACERKVEKEEDCNFVQNSLVQRVSWEGNLPVKFFVHESVPVEYLVKVHSAVDRWNALRAEGEAPFFEIVAEGVNGEVDLRDRVNTIYFQEVWEDSNEKEQGRASIHWVGSRILEADILINDYNFDFSITDYVEIGRVDFESLMVHELGHTLGLEHNDGDEISVMRTYLAKGDDRREIQEADLGSLSCEYL